MEERLIQITQAGEDSPELVLAEHLHAGLMFAGCMAWRFTMQGGRPPEEQDSGMTVFNTASFSIMIIGAGATVASIPCLAVGQTRRKTTLKTYNKNSVIEPSLTFYVKTSSDGLGIAMQF